MFDLLSLRAEAHIGLCVMPFATNSLGLCIGEYLHTVGLRVAVAWVLSHT